MRVGPRRLAGGGEHCSFTGAFVGLVAFGASGGEIPAYLRYFDYEGLAP
jgi:beta-xylosidase